MLQHMCTNPTNQRTLPRQQLATNQPTNQPTSQPNSGAKEPANQQPTEQPKKTKSQPTNKPSLSAHWWGEGFHNRGGGGAKHATTSHPTTRHNTALYGVVVQQTPHAHIARTREGLIQLLGNACPQCNHFQSAFWRKCHTCKKAVDTLPNLKLNKKVSQSLLCCVLGCAYADAK